jgi:hypothetical protein
MPNNYVLLETIALTQSATSVTFDNLPTSGYTDLKVVISARHSTTSADMYLRFNNLTTNLSDRVVYGLGASTAGSNAVSNIRLTINSGSSTANTFGNSEVYIPNYRSAVAHSVSVDSVAEDNGTTNNIMWLGAGLWNSATAITSIELVLSTGNFAANSTFSLYGIAALGTTPVLAPKATGGNIVANDGTYWYHAFTSSGNFVPQVGLTADVLVVAGGGAGAEQDAGGGGAGGIFYATSQSITSGTNYACTVGAGGSYSDTQYASGNSGSNSTFGALTAAVGGGGGAGTLTSPAPSGGSGGGGASTVNSGGVYGASTQTATGGTGYGNRGGSGAANYAGGGGGGAGAVGSNATSGTGGAGGAGLNTWSSWASVTNTGVSGYYAGGGGGAGGTASGGAGGGGASAVGGAAGDGIANTGGGGGGQRNYGAGSGTRAGSGGSGIILIRYPIA